MNKGKPIAVNEYHFLKTIGQGSFAEVKMVTKLEDEADQTMSVILIEAPLISFLVETLPLPLTLSPVTL
jgi:hypothetical protein